MPYLRTRAAVLAGVVVLALAACGSSDSGSNGSGNGGNSGDAGGGSCLTADQVQEQVDKIAGGVESSQDEVEAKQQAIQKVRDKECP